MNENPGPQVEMPRYRSHKTVSAVKIIDTKLSILDPDTVTLMPDDRSMLPLKRSREWCEKRNVLVPGYFVVYEDGYESWSPVKAFEDGYTRIK